MWQFEQATHGLKDACAVLGIPVTGGNVSFYNQTGETPILPTPVVGILGVIDDVRQRITQGFICRGQPRPGARRDPRGAVRLDVGRCRPRPPRRSAAASSTSRPSAPLADLMVEAAKTGVVESAHDLSDGGLAMALAEASFRHGVGVTVDLDDPFLELFSESSARAMVVVAEDRHDEFVDARREARRRARVGRAARAATRSRSPASSAIPVAELKAAWQATLPAVLGAHLA